MSSGGIFNTHPVDCSPETRRLLQVLMKEAKLSISQQKDISSRMAVGAPMPVRAKSAPPSCNQNLFDMKRNYHFCKRTRERIEDAGYYDVEPYVSHHRPVDRLKETEILQHVMTFGKKPRSERKKVAETQNSPKVLTKQKRLQELHQEIEERIQFLRDMTSLGQASRYETAIKQEIASKIRERNHLEKMTDHEFSRIFSCVV